MNAKKIATIIVLVAGLLLVALVVEIAGDKTYERNEYAKPISKEQTLTAEEREALEQELYDARVNASWQSTKLSILLSPPSPEKVNVEKANLEKTKTFLKKAITDAYVVAENAVKKADIPFVKTYAEIISKKKQVDSTLNTWKNAINAGKPPSPTVVNSYLGQVNDYLESVQDVLNTITPANSGLTQEQINEYKQDIVESIAEINNSVTSLNQAQTSVEVAQDRLETTQSAGNEQAIAEQTQVVLESQAKVSELEEALAGNQNENTGTETNSNNSENSNTNGTSFSKYVELEEEPLDPNIKVIQSYDPSKPNLKQD